ncbi:MAG: phenylalanine--tRNA ligase subunit beta [Thermanaeromonas sp.]|uniref:phenylalanine--tRNA ligase subunit beta n=1 Tax=Thermanaeromonas sp. TaxID=2003697 RepID=UPI00243E52E3|nr:phenylalanine--tRNA ligase subunit beta [Thermanaeromonas sp.]MCG0278668.1 phenylalanine--tRNA ligase subunit beta [Thermanaeromonas sp.]
MRVPYSWLKEYVEIELPPEELAQKLTMAGLPVENIINLSPGFSGVVAGIITAIEDHPHADHLKICQVDVGEKCLQVVSGAPNMRVGQRVAVALEGARLPGGREIRRAIFRGVESLGMLCSAQELGLDASLVSPEDREGILTLPPDASPGQDVARVLGLDEVVLELEVTTNRADCLSILGVAREVSALTGVRVKEPRIEFSEVDPPAGDLVSVNIDAPQMCGRYVARIVRNVSIGPSPSWMQARLRACGMRPINNIVDITNYVMLELGQPLHAFDYDLLKGKKIIVRRARKGEKIITLDGQERVLEDNLLVIADEERAVAIAGVMGGLETEVTGQTANILIESAHFDGVSIRRASRRLGLRSEASLRFERGVDIEGAPRAADRAAELMQKLAGGSIARGQVDCYATRKKPVTIRFRPEKVNYFLGTELSQEEIKEILQRLQLKIKTEGPDTWQVEVPSHRGDLTQEIDLVEEVARLHGYDHIPVSIPAGVVAGEKKSRRQEWEEAAREAAISCGLTQVITYSFISPKIWDLLQLPPEHKWRKTVVLQNPLREEQSVLRTTLLPGLLEVAARNASRQVMPVAIFEIGRVFLPQGDGLPQEPLRLAGLVMGSRNKGWNWPALEMDFYYLKGVVEGILERVRISKVQWEPTAAYPFLHPGRSAEILGINMEPVGFAGELHPDVLSAFELPTRAYVFELDWEILMNLTDGIPGYQPLPKFPAVDRDLAVVVPEEVLAESVREVIIDAAGPFLKECRLFDLYRGQQVGEGKKSLAFTLSFQREDRTLTDAEVNSIIHHIEKELGRRLGAALRQE